MGLGRRELGETTALLYGLGYTYDFGRGLPLPFLDLTWRASHAWRLAVLLPVAARFSFHPREDLSLGVGTAVAGDNARYRGVDALGGEEIRRLRIARVRVGVGGRYHLGRTVQLGLDLGVEGASMDEGFGGRHARGGYLEASIGYGGRASAAPGPQAGSWE